MYECPSEIFIAAVVLFHPCFPELSVTKLIKAGFCIESSKCVKITKRSAYILPKITQIIKHIKIFLFWPIYQRKFLNASIFYSVSITKGLSTVSIETSLKSLTLSFIACRMIRESASSLVQTVIIFSFRTLLSLEMTVSLYVIHIVCLSLS